MSRRRRALSLVEVLLAAVILGMMAIPMVGLFQMGNRMGVAGAREFEATLLANEVIELLRAEMDSRIANTDRVQSRPRVTLQAPEGFTYGVDAEDLGEGLDRCKVTVRWVEGKRTRDLTLETLISRRPTVNIVPTKADGSRRAEPGPALPAGTPAGTAGPARRSAGFQLPKAGP